MTYSEELLGSSASRSPRLDRSRPTRPRDFEHAAVTSFLRPGPEVVNESIPVVFVGRNRDGIWVVREANGRFGGLFWRKRSALRFVSESAWPAGCATVFPQARFELDIENAGNPLIAHIASARRLLTRQVHRAIVSIRKTLRF